MRLFAFFVATFSLSLCLAQTKRVICIDPGHPSEVGVGTRGKSVTEVGVCWTIAKELQIALEKQGYKVVLTKSAEMEKVLNKQRATVANEAKADLMVRLHCDASSSSGFQVFYPTVKGKSGDTTGPSDAVLKSSGEHAKLFHAALKKSLSGKLNDLGLSSDKLTAVGSKQGALTGSIFSEVPVLLVEMVVLTNPKDEAFIASESGRKAMVAGLLAGVQASVKP